MAYFLELHFVIALFFYFKNPFSLFDWYIYPKNHFEILIFEIFEMDMFIVV